MASTETPGLGALLAGRYEIQAEVGRGGHSIVYRARDRSLGTAVALKLLSPPPSGADVARERLRREVQAVRGLSHEHIVAVHDFLEDAGRTFVVMEFVNGPDLGAHVTRRGPLSVEDARAIGEDIARALAAAHRRGILHRDVKPQNILVDPPGRGRLTDFGSARLAERASVTETGAVVGTLLYMAPEILAGERGDARSDVYALGLTLYWAVTGDLPERPSRHLPPPATDGGFHLRARNPDLPEWLDRVVARATEARPSRRFPTAEDMAEVLNEEGAHTRVAPTLEPLRLCLLCGGEDPLELGVCPACGGAAGAATDTVVFVSGRTPETQERLGSLLAGRVSGEAAGRVLAGQRALIRLPQRTAARVAERLGDSGVPLRAVPLSRAWAPMPLTFYAMTLAVAVVGTLAGRSVTALQWLSVPIAIALLLLGQLWLLKPALRLPRRAPALRPEVEEPIIETLAELPPGTGRSLLADVVQAARGLAPRLAEMEDLEAERGLEEIVRQACRGAREVADMEDLLARVERRRTTGSAVQGGGEAVAGLERTRDRLVQLLLEVITLLGRTRRAAAEGFLEGSEMALLGRELDERSRNHAAALAEIDAFLGTATVA